VKTSATYISKLEKELHAEKEARERLEKELEEIKRISSEISSHLGLDKK
jgi:predicted RNase H-like nuclease (RuvC/YqgF family)